MRNVKRKPKDENKYEENNKMIAKYFINYHQAKRILISKQNEFKQKEILQRKKETTILKE
jgi:hypothetical protein